MKNIDTLEEILEAFRKQCVNKENTGNGFEATKQALNLYIEGKIKEELQTMQIIDFDGEDGSMTLDEYLENRIKELEK